MHHHSVFGPGERGIFLPVDAQEPVIVTASNADFQAGIVELR